MKITKNAQDKRLTLALEGRLDTMTAPELEAQVDAISGIEELIFDLAALEYVSSAGLRVLLKAQKLMTAAAGTMKVISVNETINEVFEITGFVDILTIE